METEPTTDRREAILAMASRWQESPPPDVVAELHNLVQAYALFTDNGRADELTGLFTDDATWDGTELGYGVAHGPEAIAAAVLQHFDSARPMIHVPGPPLLVAVSESEVRGVGWCLATRSGGDGSGPMIYFHYDDEFRRDAGRWRFARRTLLLRFRSR
jgi:SnoaL-like domain